MISQYNSEGLSAHSWRLPEHFLVAHFEIVIDDTLILNTVLDSLFYQDIHDQPSSINLITLKERSARYLKKKQ